MDVPAGARIRVVLADDHPAVLAAICGLLETEVDVVRTVNHGMGLINAVAETHPDAVIVDMRMDGIDGIEAGRRILQVDETTAIILLTAYNEPQLVQRALTAGLRGFVLKVDASEELIPAVRTVLAGNTYISRTVRSALAH